MKKLSKEKKRKIKEVAFKVLHTVCYILSALFLLTMFIVGLQSCKQAQGNSADTGTSEYLYAVNLDNNVMMTENTADSINDQFGLVYNDAYFGTSRTFQLTGLYNIYDDDSGTWYPNQNIYYTFYCGYIGDAIDRDMWFLNRVYSDSLELIYYDTYDGEYIELYSYEVVIKSYSFDSRLNWFYTWDKGFNFEFNKIFNYNAVYGGNLGMTYLHTGMTITDGWHYKDTVNLSSRYYLQVPVFFSNGQQFNTIITTWHDESGGVLFDDNGDGNYYAPPSNTFFYMEMAFAWKSGANFNSITVVNQRNVVTGYSDTFNLPYTAFTNSTTWVNDGYRYLSFIRDLNAQQSNDLLAFNNNNQNAYLGNNDDSNIFVLVGSAFASWLPILNMMILPNITIGMLLFIPLVAMLVFAIIRIIKK